MPFFAWRWLVAHLSTSGAREVVDYHSLSLTESARLIGEGKIRSRDLVAAAIEQARATRDLNAFITLNGEAALKAAQAADSAYG